MSTRAPKAPVPGPAEATRQALQQLVVALPSIVALPLLTGLDAGMALLAAGAGTLLFQFLTRSRVPVLLGSSYSFAYVLVTVARTHGSANVAGVACLAGLVMAGAAAALRLVPAATLRRLLPPHVAAGASLALGLALVPVAVQGANGGTSPAVVQAFGAWGAWIPAAVALAAGLAVLLLFPGRGLARGGRLPVLIGIAAGAVVALPLGGFDFAAVLKAPWIGLPRFALPRLAPQLILTAVAVGLIAAVEHTADLIAMGAAVGDDYVGDPGLARTLLSCGSAGAASALVGGVPLAFSAESMGVAAATGLRDPMPIRWAAFAMIGLAFVPKLGAALSAAPKLVVGGVSLLLYGAVCVRAVKRFVDARVDLADVRVLVVLAVMIALGVGGAEIAAGPVGVSGAALALVAGVVMNLAVIRKAGPAAPPAGGKPR
jgi:uracil permease